MSGRFEDLDVWKNSMRMATDIYSAFDNSRDFGLRDQICRAAVSVPSNIAEGFERGSDKEFVRFLRFSLGSAAELRTQLYLAVKINKIDIDHGNHLIEQTKVISGQLVNLIKYRSQ
jgi:four helix bundle protein